jgi:hypothetical protein
MNELIKENIVTLMKVQYNSTYIDYTQGGRSPVWVILLLPLQFHGVLGGLVCME